MPKPKTRTTEKDAIAILKADHKKVRGLLSDFEDTSNRATTQREELLQIIERELKIHSTIEEEIFYPAFRDAAEKQDDKKLFYEAVEEHHVVDAVLAELKEAEPASEQFGAKAKVLKDLVEHHAEEEETEMFPRARKLLGPEKLAELGQRLAEAKLTLTEKVLTKLVELVRP